jgi:type IV pilus assembly protein PilC
MPVFTYSARKKTGERVEATIDAPDRHAALLQIERSGLIPVKVAEQGGGKAAAPARGKMILWHGRKERMSQRDVLQFSTELRDLLQSGMSLGNALNTLATRETGKSEDVILKSIRDEIVRGSSLSDAMLKHPETFTSLYVSMIKAGEASGALVEVLGRLVLHFEKMQELKEKVVMALVYPGIVVGFGALTLIFSMLFVIPKFEVMFAQMKMALPLPTRILIEFSSWSGRYGLLLLAVIAVLIALFRRYIHTKNGELAWHSFLLKMPLLRGIIASSVYANLSRTLGSLLANGVPVLQALGIVEKTAGNAIISRELRKARDRVTDGTSISGPLAAGKVFPRIMTDMMAIGEQTGDMPGALEHVARRYENELDRHVKIFTAAIEPILIVVVAILVGFIAISILMAVFSMSSGLE